MSHYRYITERQREIVTTYANGAPMALICKRFGVHKSTIRNLAREAGVPIRKIGRDWSMARVGKEVDYE